ncbi:MAG: hypothetical protein ABEH64_00090 [Salinirussus sp.]
MELIPVRTDISIVTRREATLRELATALESRQSVAAAWLAKSFTDRLLVVELASDRPLPAPVRAAIETHDLEPYDEVYDVPAPDAADAGVVAGSRRYRFVDMGSRGTLQSYVID